MEVLNVAKALQEIKQLGTSRDSDGACQNSEFQITVKFLIDSFLYHHYFAYHPTADGLQENEIHTFLFQLKIFF